MPIKKSMAAYVNKMLDSHRESQLGLMETDEEVREKNKKIVYQFEKKWFSLFYEFGAIDPQHYADDVGFLYDVLKRYSYQTFGKNILTMEEFMCDPIFQRLFMEVKKPEGVSAAICFSMHLLLEESKKINELYEAKSDNLRESIEKVVAFFEQWRKVVDPNLYERDGFGMYRLLFDCQEDRMRMTFNREEFRESIAFDSFDIGFVLDQVEAIRKQILTPAKEAIEAWCRNNAANLYPSPPISFHSIQKNNQMAYAFSCKDKQLVSIREDQGLLTRENGDIVYNTDTLVREIFEGVSEWISEKENVQIRAIEHFHSTLSEKDEVGTDFVRIAGEKFDYIILKKSVSIHDVVRVEKGKPLTEEFVHALCIHPKKADIPRFDGFATLSMLIKSGNESMINAIANVHRIQNINKIQEIYQAI
jgi:hypothetical protein